MKLLVSVTEKHIREGRKRSCRECPIALALLDAGIAMPCVQCRYALVGEQVTRVQLPQSAQNFIDGFDTGLIVQPFTFTFDLPDGVATENLAG